MWIFTPFGFFSIVQKPDRTDKLCVRSRSAGHLHNLQKRLAEQENVTMEEARERWPVIDNEGTDYQVRIWVEHATLAATFASAMKAIDYNNFKNRVAQCDKKLKGACTRIWGTVASAYGYRW